MYLIAGLGNPGPEYENTRHNLGFKTIEALLPKLSLTELKFKKKCDALIAEGNYKGHKIILAEPQTFMNHSGRAVQALLSWYKISPTHLIVIYDDLDLPAGVIRVRDGGSSGGHKGVESIILSIGRSDFKRVRIGIGRDELIVDAADYVLQKIPPGQKETLSNAVALAAEAVLEILPNG